MKKIPSKEVSVYSGINLEGKPVCINLDDDNWSKKKIPKSLIVENAERDFVEVVEKKFDEWWENSSSIDLSVVIKEND